MGHHWIIPLVVMQTVMGLSLPPGLFQKQFQVKWYMKDLKAETRGAFKLSAFWSVPHCPGRQRTVSVCLVCLNVNHTLAAPAAFP